MKRFLIRSLSLALPIVACTSCCLECVPYGNSTKPYRWRPGQTITGEYDNNPHKVDRCAPKPCRPRCCDCGKELETGERQVETRESNHQSEVLEQNID